MILSDRVTIIKREQHFDDYGTPVWRDGKPTITPAEVRPVTSEEGDAQGYVSTKYRVFLPTSAAGMTAQDKIKWQGMDFEVMGDYEPHKIVGRLHHIEVVVRRRA